MLWNVKANFLRKLDSTCAICQSQCSDLYLEQDNFFDTQSSQWVYLEALACGIDEKIAAVTQMINMTSLYAQTAKKYANLPTLGQISEILQPGLVTIGTRYNDFKKNITKIASLFKQTNICNKTTDFSNMTTYIISAFMYYLDQNETKAADIQSKCGFNACRALSTTSKELKNAHIPNTTFTNSTQIFNAQQAIYLLADDLGYYSSFYLSLIAPLNDILDKKYTACNGTNKCHSATGLAIIAANNTEMDNMFPGVVQRVNTLIANKLWYKLYFTNTANSGQKGVDIPMWNIPKNGIVYPYLHLTYGDKMKACLDKIGTD